MFRNEKLVFLWIISIKTDVDADSSLRGAFSCGMGTALKCQCVFEGSKSAGVFSHADIQQNESTSYCVFAVKQEYDDDPEPLLTSNTVITVE